MPTDVTLGWLTNQALAKQRLVCVHLRAAEYSALPRAATARSLRTWKGGSGAIYVHSNVLRTEFADVVTARFLNTESTTTPQSNKHCEAHALDAWSHVSTVNWTVIWTKQPSQSCSVVLPA